MLSANFLFVKTEVARNVFLLYKNLKELGELIRRILIGILLLV